MKNIVIEAQPRVTSGTGGARKVRAAGYIPGILLGHKLPAVTFQVKMSDVLHTLRKHGPNALMELKLEGNDTLAMIREFTRHPVSREIIHVDFMRVAADEPVEAPVPVIVVGEPPIEFSDYVVTHELNNVRVKALPAALPSHIEVDASTLEGGKPLLASELTLPESVELVEEPEMVILSLVAPKLQLEETEEAEPVEEGEEQEPAEE